MKLKGFLDEICSRNAVFEEAFPPEMKTESTRESEPQGTPS